MWNKTVTLVTTESIIVGGKNKQRITEQKTVFCNELSVGYNELYASNKVGINTDLKLKMRTEDYTDQKYLFYEGKTYRFIRGYKSKNGEYIELSLENLKGGIDNVV